MDSIIFHIDVNSAYLSWTALERLSDGDAQDLRLIPSIVGGDMEKRRGVVLAKSDPARKYGIKTGEPVVNAFRKCPSLIMVPPDHTLYAKCSGELMTYLSDFCPDIEQVSVDECYMDFTPIAQQYKTPVSGADHIREEILKTFGFTVNIGVSDRRVLAKMASDFQKPNLTHTLFSWEIEKKMWALPVSSLYMCGNSSVETLRKLEILTIGDLARTDPQILEAHLKSHGRLLWQYANGIDDAPVITRPVKAKGIGNSITLPQDAVTARQAKTALLSLSESVASRLRAARQQALSESIEIKYADFQTVSHQTTFSAPVDNDWMIYETACRLFDEIWNQAPIRLLGIRTAKLCQTGEAVQLSLFDLEQPQRYDKQQKMDETIDTIRNRYGKDAVVRGSLLGRGEEFKKH